MKASHLTPNCFVRGCARRFNRGTLYYDGTCGFCVGGVRFFGPLLESMAVGAEAFNHGAIEPEMKLRWKDGKVRGGADAAFFLARRVWWLAPLGWLEWVPGCLGIARILYRAIAERRHCRGPAGACRI